MIKLEFPDSLNRQLSTFEGKLRRVESAVTISSIGIGLLASWVLLYASDRIWDSPVWFRFGCMIGSVIICFGAARLWLNRWVLRRRSVRELARIIQAENPQLGDRLLGVVELAESDLPDNISPSLVRAAIRQVAKESEDLDFREAVRTDSSGTVRMVFVGLACVLVGLIVYNRDAVVNALQRWAAPQANIERYTFVRLKDVPAEKVVAHGEPFDFPVEIDKDSFRKPTGATARIGKLAKSLRVPVVNDRADFRCPRLTEEAWMHLRVWDATKRVKIRPMHRPAIETLEGFVTYPPYLGRSTRSERIRTGRVTVVEGSKISFRADLGREIASAKVDVIDDSTTSQKSAIVEKGFLTSDVEVATPVAMTMTWEDIYGLTPVRPYDVKIATVPDRAPVVDMVRQPEQEAILIDDSKVMEVLAQDDLGLKEVWIEYFVSDSDGNRLNKRPGEQRIKLGGPEKMQLSGKFVFAPSVMGIPSRSIVTLHACTKDYYPKRDVVRSPKYQLYILSREEHAALVKERFERIQARLEELTRAQAALKEKTDKLQKQSKDKLDRKQTEDKIRELERKQQANKDEIDRLAKSGMEMLKEALRNKGISTEHLREWAQMLEKMKSISNQGMSQARKSLSQARKNKGMRKEDLKKASERMADTIKKMQKLLKEFNQSMENLAAQNFIQQLEHLAGEEKKVKAETLASLRDTIGSAENKLSESAKKKLKTIVKITEGIHSKTGTLMDDLDAFFARTRLEDYDKVLQEMRKHDLLEKLRAQVRTAKQNQGISLMEVADRWAKEFTKWAEMLKKRSNRRGGGGGGGGQMSPEKMAMLLKLMRVIQGEYNLINKTRRAEQMREFDEDYAEKAKGLADEQGELRTTLNEIIKKAPAAKVLEKAGKAMDDARDFLEIPETGKQTRGAQWEVIHLLTTGLQNNAKKMGASDSIIAMMMQQMMQQMGMKPGAAGGGSMAGGSGDSGNTKVEGRGDENVAERSVSRASGKSLEQVPIEFREALRAYFDEVDRKTK